MRIGGWERNVCDRRQGRGCEGEGERKARPTHEGKRARGKRHAGFEKQEVSLPLPSLIHRSAQTHRVTYLQGHETPNPTCAACVCLERK